MEALIKIVADTKFTIIKFCIYNMWENKEYIKDSACVAS